MKRIMHTITIEQEYLEYNKNLVKLGFLIHKKSNIVAYSLKSLYIESYMSLPS